MVAVPELKNYLGKEIRIELNGNRTIQGKLGGFDFFLNLTVNECVEIKSPKTKPEYITLGQCIVRGNSTRLSETA